MAVDPVLLHIVVALSIIALAARATGSRWVLQVGAQWHLQSAMPAA